MNIPQTNGPAKHCLSNLNGAVAVIMWGTLGVLGKFSQNLNPQFVLAVCFAVASIIGAVVCLYTHRQIRVGSISRLVMFVVLLSGYHLVYLASFKYAPALHVSLINYLWPAFLILLGNVFFSLGSGWRGYTGALLGFTGIGVLMFGDRVLAFDNTAVFGYLLALIGALLWALFSNLRRNDQTDSIASMTMICFVSSIVCALLMLIGDDVPKVLLRSDIIVVLLLAVGPAGGAFFLWDIGLRHGNAAFLAIFGYLAPIISTALMIAFGFGEPRWNVFVAALLIAVGGAVNLQKNISLQHLHYLRQKYIP